MGDRVRVGDYVGGRVGWWVTVCVSARDRRGHQGGHPPVLFKVESSSTFFKVDPHAGSPGRKDQRRRGRLQTRGRRHDRERYEGKRAAPALCSCARLHRRQ